MADTMTDTNQQRAATPKRRLGALSRFFSVATSVQPTLPVVHTTTALAFRDMAEAGEMTPQPCDVFVGEDLLYFFYGKPSYRLFADHDSALTAEAPIALILSPNIAANAARLFPFDSGGFDRYKAFMPRQFKLTNFQLDVPECPPNRIVGAFFSSNRSYFDGEARADALIEADQFEAESLYEILRFKGKGALDDRAWSIEIQVQKSIPLNGSTVLAVVMPSVLIGSELGLTVVDQWKVPLLPYKLSGRGKPADYHALVREQVRTFLVEREFL